MAFSVDAIRLTEEANLEITGGPSFSTNVVQTKSGYRQANKNWQFALWKVRLRYIRRSGDFTPIIAFWLGRRGPAHPFKIQDPLDHTDAGNGQVILHNGQYRLAKVYPDDVRPYTRLITSPVSGTIALSGVAKSGGGFCTAADVNMTTGVIANATSTGTWTGQFDIPVAFTGDFFEYNMQPGGIIDCMDVMVEEVRVP